MNIEVEIKEPDKFKDNLLVRYSAFVAFPYDLRIAEFIKKMPLFSYNSKDKIWEIPIYELPKLCNKFTDCDIHITGTYHKIAKSDKKIPKGFKFKTKPYKYQKEGVEFALSKERFILGDECGLGKSKMVIDFCGCLKHQKLINKVLIVCCVNSLKWNWVNEVKIHSDYSAYVLGTRKRKNGKVYNGGTKAILEDLNNLPDNDFIIINVEGLRGGSKKVGNKYQLPIADKIATLCNNGTIGAIAVDEIHLCKSTTSLQSKALLRLNAKYKVAMTGTPIMNQPLDLYVPLYWLGYENRNFFSFKSKYAVLGGWNNTQVVGYKNLDELRNVTQEIMLRRLKDEVLELPPKLYKTEYVEMTAKQEQIYEQVRLGLLANVEQIAENNNPLLMFTRLKQATGYTGIIDPNTHESAKFDRLLQYADEIVSNNQKFIVFSEWTGITNAVKPLLKDFNPAYITGEIKDSERIAEVNKFQNDDTCKCIIGTRGAMGTGLTLTAASYVIFIDNPWNMALKQQAIDRAHRVSTNHKVTIIDLVCKDTIDEKILDIVKLKGQISEIMLNGKLPVSEINYLLGV